MTPGNKLSNIGVDTGCASDIAGVTGHLSSYNFLYWEGDVLAMRSIGLIFSATVMVLGASVVAGQTPSTGSGQAYPSKPIRIFTGSAGGSNDAASRLIAQGSRVPWASR